MPLNKYIIKNKNTENKDNTFKIYLNINFLQVINNDEQ